MDLAKAEVAQLMIPVDDFERGSAFYRDTLGLPLLFAAPPQMAFFQCGTVRLLVGVLPSGQKAARGSAIYFRVEDTHSVYKTLKDRGVHFVAEPHVVNRAGKSELWLAEFSDPDGNQLALLTEVATGSA